MKKQSKDITREKSSSRKAQDTLGERYVFVKYSELTALRQSTNDASIALSQIAKYGLDTRSMSMLPKIIDGLSLKLTDISVIRPSMQSRSKVYEAGESLASMGQILKSIGSHSKGSPSGPTKRLQKRWVSDSEKAFRTKAAYGRFFNGRTQKEAEERAAFFMKTHPDVAERWKRVDSRRR